MRRLSEAIDKLARFFAGISVAVAAVVVIAQVFVRFFMGFSFPWGDELARYLLVWTTFLGASSALKEGKMASVTLLVDKLSPILTRIVAVLVDLIIGFFLVIMIYHGFNLVTSPTILKQVSPAMRLPMYWTYGVIPVSALFMLIHTIVMIWDKVFPRREVREN